MTTILHTAATRGHANYGWLKANHSFSFANYYNPERMGFGALRVLNDDEVAGGMGFGRHPHDNMEIVTIPLEGALKHQDSMGNSAVIQSGEIQAMSAGTGIFHSEINANTSEAVRLLQIWVLPNAKNVASRYDQITLAQPLPRNAWQQIVSPNPDDAGIWIHQNAWFHLGEIDENQTLNYTLRDPENGVYAFVIEGAATVANHDLSRRDALGIQDATEFSVTATAAATRLLLIEVPM